MMHIDRSGKVFYCPLKANRKVGDSGGERPGDGGPRLARRRGAARQVGEGAWVSDGLQGQTVPGCGGQPLGNLPSPTDLPQDSAVAVEGMCGVRWRIEQYHREGKQMLGMEKCQCRKARALDGVEHAEGDQLAWAEGGLAVVGDVFHVVVYAAEQIGDKTFVGHGLVLLREKRF
jgi:hypothetical protein